MGISRLLAISGTRRTYLVLAGGFALVSAFCALVPHILVYRIMVQLLDPGFGPWPWMRDRPGRPIGSNHRRHEPDRCHSGNTGH